MFLFPPTSIGKDYSHRYGKKDLGDLKGDLIPLGIASLAAYLRNYGYGVGALDCIALELTHEDIVEIVRKKKTSIYRYICYNLCSSSFYYIGR